MDFLNTKGCMGAFKTLITNDEIYIDAVYEKGDVSADAAASDR